MTYSSSLASDPSPLILDTSVLINLHASQHGEHVLTAMPNDVYVPEIVATELGHQTGKLNGEHGFLQTQAASGKVQIVPLSEEEYEVYAALVSGRGSLGDGEAATIAVAASRNMIPVIDERKGRLQAQTHCKGRIPGWSLDLFRHPQSITTLGESRSIDALYLALRDGRMRIPDAHCDHVVGIIGARRALECNSLPNYKMRRQAWENELVSSENAVRSMGPG